MFNESNLTDWIGVSNSAAQTTPGVITLTFTGLDDSLTYDLIVGAGFASNISDVLWEADSQSATTDSSVGADSFVTLSGLSTDGSGNLVITGTGTGNATTRADIVVVSALHLTATAGGGQTAFEAWATRGGASGVTFEGDANQDGVPDGMAFQLGADTPATDATGLLPTASESAGDLVMTFICLADTARGASVLNLEWDGDLTPSWSSVGVPGTIGTPSDTDGTGTVNFVATDGETNGEGDALIHIVATIDDDTEAADGKLFGRLQGTETP